MLPRWHILLGFMFSLLIYAAFNIDVISFLILFISTWVIDIDHYFWYIIKKRNIKFSSAYKYFFQRRGKLKNLPKKQILQIMLNQNRIFVLHSIEMLFAISIVFLIILKKFRFSVLYIYLFLLGVIFHISLDILEGNTIKERYSIILFLIAKKKNKKNAK